MIPPDDRLEIETAGALWDWLGQNHTRDAGLWLVTFKAADRARYVGREAVLDALIAHGWIDGRRMVLDDARTMQWVSPRRHQVWAQTYKDRAARLEAEGRMHPAGRAAIQAAQAAGQWPVSDPIDALIVPDDLRATLELAGGSVWFDAAAPSYRRNVLRWLSLAKGADTRARRAGVIADHAARGLKVPQY